MANQEYNGWTNYETWAVNLWLTNEQGSDSYWRETAEEIYNESETETSFTRAERASLTLADRLKSEHEETQPELGASLWADLLGAAMSEVNWYEIAEHFIADTDQTCEESDEYDAAIDSPDAYLKHAQRYLNETYQIANPGIGGLRAPEFYEANRTLAHARYQVGKDGE
jgi:hypothetical protein